MFKQEAISDIFGDFKFDSLDPNAGTYPVEVSHPQFGTVRREADLRSQSLNLGEICLDGNSI